MNIDFNAEFDAGKSREEILASVTAYLESLEKERAAAAEEERQAALMKARAHRQEAYKAEARAYLINAMLAYIDAFELLPEGETLDEEDVKKMEEMIIQYEAMIPVYMAMFSLQNLLDDDEGKDKLY